MITHLPSLQSIKCYLTSRYLLQNIVYLKLHSKQLLPLLPFPLPLLLLLPSPTHPAPCSSFLSTYPHPFLYMPPPLFSLILPPPSLLLPHLLFLPFFYPRTQTKKTQFKQRQGVLYPSCGKHSLLMTTFLFSHFIRGNDVVFSTISFSSSPGQVSTNVLCGSSGNDAKKKLTQLLPGL